MAKNNNNVIYISIGAALLLFLVYNETVNASPSSNGVSVSSDQISQTMQFESFSATAYPDGSNGSTQLYSIGYGHQIGPNEQNLLTQSITQAQAQQYLQNDMQVIVNIIAASGVSFTQGQIDCLSDFGYSAGPDALNKVIATYQSSGSDAAASEILAYVYWHPVVGGPPVLNNNLVARRNAEVNSWNS